MHIEFRHLRTIKAIHEEGGLARAADGCTSRRARCRHQIKGLEDQAGVELFVRRSRPMRLSPAGMKLLRLAEDVLPRIAALEEEFEGLRSGKSGRLHIAIECHACFDWLLPVLEAFRNPGPRWMSISARGCSSRRCRRCCGRRWTWSCPRTPRTCRASISRRFSITSRSFVCAADHPLAAKAVDRGGGFRRSAPDHLPGGTRAAGRVQPAPVPGGGGAAVDPAGGAVGGDAAAGGLGARGGGAARLGGARPAHAGLDRDAAPDRRPGSPGGFTGRRGPMTRPSPSWPMC
jgi:DNA-binding transcriptional LysR family regulator